MSEGAYIGLMSVTLVCSLGLMITLITFLRRAQKKHPKAFDHMVNQTRRNARWVGKTYLVNPARDLWEDK